VKSVAESSRFGYVATVPEKQRATLICLVLALVTLAVYWPATHFDFTNYDDPDYVILNGSIQRGFTPAMVVWAFKTSYASNWHPLTWISHAADCSLYGLHPGGHHLTNLLFHAANSVLLFLVLWQLTGSQWRSALVAALFAWHPLHVESVAWISERKDVLSAFFWLLTMSAYGKYAAFASTRNSKSKTFYVLALIGFALALLSKPMVVTLPCVLLLLDFWPLNRMPSLAALPKLILEKIPFFALASLDSFATFWAQKETNSVVSSVALPFGDRIATVSVSYVLYLKKTFWPTDLALPYPYSTDWSFPVIAGAALLLVVISAIALLRARNESFLLVGWLWFLGTLVPVIGLVQVGIQSMADRYSYLPLIGIFIMVAWAIPAAWTQWPRPGFVFGAVIAGALMFMLAGTEVQLQYWRNSATLFSHTVTVTSNNILAEYNLAEALTRLGDEPQAIVHYQAALAIRPNRVEAQYNSQTQAHYNLGLIFRAQKKWPEAADQFRAFIQDEPRTPAGHLNLGVAFVALGQVNDATNEFHQAIKLHSLEPGENEDIEVLAKIESAYAEAGKLPEAIAAAQKTRDTALAAGRKDLADAAEQRITSYRSTRP